MEIRYTIQFRKQYQKARKEIKTAFSQMLDLFLEDPNHPALRNHSLKREFSGYESIDVTEDWRALFKIRERDEQKVITFHMLGTHKTLYK
jgi:addiction module RelE/StbE family toxin